MRLPRRPLAARPPTRSPLRFLSGAALVFVLALPSSAAADVFGPLSEPSTDEPSIVQSGPTITSDKADYEPNDPVTLTGTGWQPGESVHIVVSDDGLQPEVWQRDVTVTADAEGNFVDNFDLPPWLVANYTVTAAGEFSGTAYTSFTDSHTERGCGNAATLVVDTTADDFDVELETGDCSLREAIVAANSDAAPHTEVTAITLPAGTYTLTRAPAGSADDGATGDLDVREDLAINGAGSGTTIVEAGTDPADGIAPEPIDRVFHQVGPAGIDFDLNDLTIRHAKASTAGGGIRAEDGTMAAPNSLDLTNVVVTLNTLTGGNGGAGIYIVAANIDTTLANTDVIDNDTASNCSGCDGGGIFNRGRSLEISDSAIDDNAAGGKGGGLWNTNGGQVDITNSTVNDNVNNNAGASDADGMGGGIYQADQDSTLDIVESTVNGNTAQGHGGGIFLTNGTLTLDRSTVSDNTLDAPRDGGGIYSSSALDVDSNVDEPQPAVEIIDSTVSGNETDRAGGGYFDNLSSNHDSLFVHRSTISGNSAGTDGGGLRIRVDATIVNSTITNNAAGTDVDDPGAGGGLFSRDQVVEVYNATVSHNEADGDGDGIRRGGESGNDGVFNLRNTIVANNDDAGSAQNCSSEEAMATSVVNITHNLDSGTTCGFGAAADNFTATNNFSQSEADPMLGDLVDNGGPTFTRGLNPGSDAIDKANATVCAETATVNDEDQRGELRPDGPECDVGAFEGVLVPPAGSVSGTKYNDLNRDGARDADGENDIADDGDDEVGLEGWTIEAYLDDEGGSADGVLSAAEVTAGSAGSTETDADGDYELLLDPGDYVVCEQQMDGWAQSDPVNQACVEVDVDAPGGHAVTADPETPVTGKNFGNYELGSVSGTKYNDLNRDGARDADGENDIADDGDDEVGLEGWTIEAYLDDEGGSADGVLSAAEVTAGSAGSTETDADGDYELLLDPGDYVVCEQQMDGWAQSDPVNQACVEVDVDAPGGHAVTADPETPVTGKNFGNYELGSVSGTKYNDLNRDGARDADGENDIADDGDDEVGLEGWTIEAYLDDEGGSADGVLSAAEVTAGSAGSTETDADGDYELLLDPGDYVVCEQQMDGWAQSDPVNQACVEVDVDAPGGHAVTADPETPVTGKNFGNYEVFVSGALVTAGSCAFDRNADVDGRQFRLTYTPEMGTEAWKLNASNPGQFFLGVAYSGTSNYLNIDIPYPFVTKGATPVKVYDDSEESTEDGKECVAPAGNLLASQSDQIALSDYSGFGDTHRIQIDLEDLGNPPFVFVRIHLDYGLKHVAAGCTPVNENVDHPYPNAECTTPDPVTILNFEDYEFSFSGNTVSGSDTVQNENVFKKDPGFAGLVTQANTGEPIGGAAVEIWQGTKKVGKVISDEDSWYMWHYKYTGKPTTFTVKLPAYGLSQSVTMKSNGFMVLNFTVPDGSTTPTEPVPEPEPEPEPAPTKPGGGKNK